MSKHPLTQLSTALGLAILLRVCGPTCGCQLELCPTAYRSAEIDVITCPGPTSGL